MFDAVKAQMENNRRQQEQIRGRFNRYSKLAAQAKIKLIQLTKEQIHLKIWGCRNAKAENNNSKAIDGRKGAIQKDAQGFGAGSEKGRKEAESADRQREILENLEDCLAIL